MRFRKRIENKVLPQSFIFAFLLLSAFFFFSTDISAEYSNVNLMQLPSDVRSDSSYGAVAADFDKDGKDEIFIANDGQDRLLKYDEAEVAFKDLTSTNLPVDADESHGVAVGDIDGDNDIDIVVANYEFAISPEYFNRVLINDGTGKFTDATSTWLPGKESMTSVSCALSDIDNDGKLDLVIGNAISNSSDAVKVYTNNGSTFTDVTSTWITSPQASMVQKVILTDVSGDGQPDLLVFCSYQVANRIYINDGNASFTDGTSTLFPPVSDQNSEVAGNQEYSTSSAAVGDIDGDGFPDIFMANEGSGVRNRIYINKGDDTGGFLDKTEDLLPDDTDFAQGCTLADLDGDLDLDIIVANSKGITNSGAPYYEPVCNGQENSIYINDGTGIFTAADNNYFDNPENLSTSIITGEFGETDANYILFTNICGQGPTLLTSAVQVGPSITTITPSKAKPFVAVTISGTGFGGTDGTVAFITITADGEESITSTITSWSDTEIKVKVPFGANTGDVTVTTSFAQTASKLFTVTSVKPSVKPPTKIKSKGNLTISGSYFGDVQGDGFVKINGKTATIKSWSNKKIVLKVPNLGKLKKATLIVKNHYGQYKKTNIKVVK